MKKGVVFMDYCETGRILWSA